MWSLVLVILALIVLRSGVSGCVGYLFASVLILIAGTRLFNGKGFILSLGVIVLLGFYKAFARKTAG